MNRLKDEKSPYLLQHKDNPVNWHPWGEEAFQLAKREAKPIFLSIGYSTCYWCHVMEKDSFEKEDVAEILNREFISIKVDREERPDVDQVHMDVVVGLTGHGGWPMSVFLTPELKPFWGGTFFYREQFKSILSQISETWKKNPDPIQNSASQIVLHLKTDDSKKSATDSHVITEAQNNAREAYLRNFDSSYGGFGSAPKFPPSMQLSFLMRDYLDTKDPLTLKAVEKTLDCMAKGGIYDQLGGGFHRYATDTKWLVPHFEKMLYDNALLMSCYLEAFQLTKNSNYLDIAREISVYLNRDMTHSAGGLYAAEDAGEVGIEGEFYVWAKDEIKSELTGEEFEAFEKLYDLPDDGNFENGNIILSIPFSQGSEPKKDPNVIKAREKLFKKRSGRERPHRDEKIITSWCALSITSFAKAFTVTGEKEFLETAIKSANFIDKELTVNGMLYRHYANGRSSIPGFLEDYAYYTEALLSLYFASSDSKWLKLAKEIQSKQDELFWDKINGGYFTSTAPELFVRKKEFFDNATPSGNSVAFSNLVNFSALDHSEDINEKISLMIAAFSPVLEKHPGGAPKFLQALTANLKKPKQLIIASKVKSEAIDKVIKVHNEFHPDLSVIATGPEDSNDPHSPGILNDKISVDGELTYYYCQNFTCSVPTKSLPDDLNGS